MSHAEISECGKYRYTLERPIALSPQRWLLWVMLNPSTADAVKDDQTIRQIIKFTRRWGYDGALVGNLFAYRATDPWEMWRQSKKGVDIIGPRNDEYLNHLAGRASDVILAWGANADQAPERARYVHRLLTRRYDVLVLGLTKSGQPVHPLYQPSERQPCLHREHQDSKSS